MKQTKNPKLGLTAEREREREREREEYNILYCVSETKKDFSRHLGVSLISLFETNKNHNISVYIITDNLAIENQKELERIVAKYNQKLFIYNGKNIVPPEIEKLLLENRTKTNYHLSVWYRLFFSKCFPDLKDRILYLDTDTLVLKDIKEFYNSDFENNIIIGNPDLKYICVDRAINLGTSTNCYINAGVILFDIKKYCEINMTNEIIRIIKKFGKKLIFGDQDVVNLVFKNKIGISIFDINSQDIKYKLLSKKEKENVIILHSKLFDIIPVAPKKFVDLYYNYLSQTRWKNYSQKQKPNLKDYKKFLFAFYFTYITEVLVIMMGKLFGNKGEKAVAKTVSFIRWKILG